MARAASGMTPFVSIVVPARNCEGTLAECLSSLLRLDYPKDRFEVIAVDNDSRDRTGEIIRSCPVRHLHESHRSPGAARNRGIEASRGEIVAFTDADCVATNGWLRELVRSFDGAGVWGVAGEVVASQTQTPAERYVAMRRPRMQESVLQRRRPFAGTANLAFRRETFGVVGLFDPMLPTAEDKDFGWRLQDAGLDLAYNPRALVRHRHRDTARALFAQFVGWGHGAAFVHRKHQPPWTLRRELPDVDLLAAIRSLIAAGFRYALRRGDRTEVSYRWFDLLRRAGLRIGAFYGRIEGATWGRGRRA